MGNCWHRCFGISDRRKNYPQPNTHENDFSIENYYMDDGFESLIDGDAQENEMTRLLTDQERQLLNTKQFSVLVHEQGKIDAEIEAKLAQQEKEIEREEAAFYEAKREAARIAKLNKDKENSSTSSNQAWVNGEDWQITADEEDFENFLASVKARSLASRSQVINGFPEAGSSGSSSAQTMDNTSAAGGFVDVKWDHDTGVAPQLKVSAEFSTNSWSDTAAGDLEWDPDFVSAED